MADIFKFQKDDVCCPYCQLVNEYFTYIMEADTADEVHELLHELVTEVRNIAYRDGYKDAMINDVETKLRWLDVINGECDCEECNAD